MKLQQITNAILKNKNKYSFYLANFANTDMVGHSGDVKATKKAVEAIDKAVGKIVKNFPGIILITADHGNAENMTGDYKKSHTTNKVPLLIVNCPEKYKIDKKKNYGLDNVAPTILELMNIKKPKIMGANSILQLRKK